MEIAFGALNMMPEHFWALTMEEFRAIVDGREHFLQPAKQVMTGDELEDMMERFPDKPQRARRR